MDVLMPQLGETVAEGKITTWFKSVGDAVKPGDNLFEIETDKVSMEVPAIAGGVVAEIRVPAGAIAPVGAIVAVLRDGAGTTALPRAAVVSAPARAPQSPVPAPRPLTTAAPLAATPPRTGALPLDPFFEVRTPSGRFGPAKLPSGSFVTHGRIVARDVAAAAGSRTSSRPGAAAPPATGPSAEQVKALYADTPYEEVPLDGMRKTIAARLTQAAQTIPHFYLTTDVELERLLRLREEANASAPKGEDGDPTFKLSVNDFVIKALALALQRVPAANAVWAQDRVLRFKHSDVGVAVAVENGLLTPVIRRADTMSLTAISAAMKDFAARAKARRLKPHEYQGGVTAISNLGMYGIREFTAIINPPHATILAVGAAQRRPVETETGAVKFVSQMTVTLSCDHRVVDGALGAELLAAFKSLIEQPVTMLV
jgi:pyruvate dehydrogenase E2 component (dihydrolipoamide acetyltransferase)